MKKKQLNEIKKFSLLSETIFVLIYISIKLGSDQISELSDVGSDYIKYLKWGWYEHKFNIIEKCGAYY